MIWVAPSSRSVSVSFLFGQRSLFTVAAVIAAVVVVFVVVVVIVVVVVVAIVVAVVSVVTVAVVTVSLPVTNSKKLLLWVLL